MNFITIDFETATSDRDSPCEIGLTFVKDNQITETRSWLIKPAYHPDFDPFNVSIHGISPEMVENEPEFDVLWPQILPLIENQFLIAHNAGFDFSVLRRTLESYSLPYPSLEYSCSYIFSKKVWQGLPGYDLKSLCKANGIDFSHHRAGADSRATAELCLKAFDIAGLTSTTEFPEKLRTIAGRLYSGGYDPSRTKSESRYKDLSKIVGDPAKHKPDCIFYGRTVVFTGTLSMVRAHAQQMIADIGGILGNTVTKDTDFLIVGQQDFRVVGEDGMSSKQEKAIKLIQSGSTLEIISENDFMRNIN